MNHWTYYFGCRWLAELTAQPAGRLPIWLWVALSVLIAVAIM